MLTLKSTFSSLLIATMLTTSVPALADLPSAPSPWPGETDVGSAVSPVRKGDAAPFTGVLLAPKSVASLVAELNSINARVKVEVDRAVGQCKAESDYKLRESQIASEADKKILSAQVESQSKQIKVFEDRVKRDEQNKPDPLFWAVGGGVGGVAFTLLTILAINYVKK